MVSEQDIEELQAVCEGARMMSEGGCEFAYLPHLKIPHADGTIVRDALLCLQQRDGYLTRLYLSEQVPGRGNNWTPHRILDRAWHTWSWNHVPADRPAVVLAQHLRALR